MLASSVQNFEPLGSAMVLETAHAIDASLPNPLQVYLRLRLHEHRGATIIKCQHVLRNGFSIEYQHSLRNGFIADKKFQYDQMTLEAGDKIIQTSTKRIKQGAKGEKVIW